MGLTSLVCWMKGHDFTDIYMVLAGAPNFWTTIGAPCRRCGVPLTARALRCQFGEPVSKGPKMIEARVLSEGNDFLLPGDFGGYLKYMKGLTGEQTGDNHERD